ncbi:uncharacterized protein LOC118429982 [Branchiostoma floridae]|uniref:Uncharacterized protein LOC118429982 n=1 Tax=Branchiostoma floridae TaxID=7739 RepID=A0A9J7M999_BRAFL|nr:uncharacterized protein LOC118429982 [Branchiostoma floridae]
MATQIHHIKYVTAAFIVCGFIILVNMNEKLSVVLFGDLAVLGATAFCSIMFIYICVSCLKRNRGQPLISPANQATQPKDVRKPLVDKDGLCIVANNLDTLNTVTEEVQQSYPWPIVQHLVTNQREIADLPTYQYAICCVRNAPRIISFNEHGELQPEADLGFRAFDKMERSTEPSGVIVILFNHPRSKDISELHCLEGITPSRLKDLAYNKRFLSVYRQFNKNQRERIKECFKVKP